MQLLPTHPRFSESLFIGPRRWRIRNNAVVKRQSLLSPTIRFIRWLSNGNSRTKLFVRGLSYNTNETVLKGAFGQHGEIVEVKVICDHVSGKSRGYGFVKFTSEAAPSMAIKDMDSQLLDGRNISVLYAHRG